MLQFHQLSMFLGLKKLRDGRMHHFFLKNNSTILLSLVLVKQKAITFQAISSFTGKSAYNFQAK